MRRITALLVVTAISGFLAVVAGLVTAPLADACSIVYTERVGILDIVPTVDSVDELNAPDGLLRERYNERRDFTRVPPDVIGIRLDTTVGAVDLVGSPPDDPWRDTITTTTMVWGEAPAITEVGEGWPESLISGASCFAGSWSEVGRLHWTIVTSDGPNRGEFAFTSGFGPEGTVDITTGTLAEFDRVFGDRTVIDRDVEHEHQLLDELHNGGYDNEPFNGLFHDEDARVTAVRWLDPETSRITHFGADGSTVVDTTDVPTKHLINDAPHPPQRAGPFQPVPSRPPAVISPDRNVWASATGAAIGVAALAAVARSWQIRRRRTSA